jgi:hypothetical protein
MAQIRKNKVYLGGFIEKSLLKDIMTFARAERAPYKFAFAIKLMEESMGKYRSKAKR